MRKLTFVLILFLLSGRVFSQEIATVKNVKIKSGFLKQTREIIIYTPQSYDESKYTYYDVIYVFDAQNRELFDYTHSLISFVTNASKNFIVVGITSPYDQKLDYSRKSDFLPELMTEESKKRYGKYSGNADNFLLYVKNEVFAYMESNYRTLGHRTAVGHSLSASFIIYAMLKEPGAFNNYIAISPNLEYDNQRLVNELKSFDYNRLKANSFLFISNADEADVWKEWKPAYEHTYRFLKDSLSNRKVSVVIKEFKNKSHWNTFAPALETALEQYFLSTYESQQKVLSDAEFDITITVKVPNKTDDIYIAGNQGILGNWKPGDIKMERVSDYTREIKLRLRSPAEFKFTKGSWESEAIVENVYTKIIIKPTDKKKYYFNIEGFMND